MYDSKQDTILNIQIILCNFKIKYVHIICLCIECPHGIQCGFIPYWDSSYFQLVWPDLKVLDCVDLNGQITFLRRNELNNI